MKNLSLVSDRYFLKSWPQENLCQTFSVLTLARFVVDMGAREVMFCFVRLVGWLVD